MLPQELEGHEAHEGKTVSPIQESFKETSERIKKLWLDNVL
jgi:hypothetical protein